MQVHYMSSGILFVIALLSACVSSAPSVSFGNTTAFVEVADSAEEWQRGLMFRDSLPEGTGMLFVFPDEAPRSFWMKNTRMPLDIIFISANMTVVDVQTMEPCAADPCASYKSAAPAKYALEASKGFANRKGIKAGDIAAISK